MHRVEFGVPLKGFWGSCKRVPLKGEALIAFSNILIFFEMSNFAQRNLPAAGYLTLGSSHTVAFLPCLEAGVADSRGKNPSFQKSDLMWQAIQKGWVWKVVASTGEEHMPDLPDPANGPEFLQFQCQADQRVGGCLSICHSSRIIKGLYWEPQIGNPKNIAGT